MRSTIPAFVAGITGALMIVASFLPPAQSLESMAQEWFLILAAIALLIGGTNLLLQHLKVVARQSAGWGFSAVTLLAFLITVFVGLTKFGVPPSENAPNHPWSGSYTEEGTAFWWIFEYVMSPILSTMFALLAFYVASAAFRAFRAKNVESILLLGTAFVVLMARCYAGAFLTGWVPDDMAALSLPGMSSMVIMAVFTTAGQRAIMIGIALGIAAISLRIIMGLDRSYLGSNQE